jgi:uncharacterized protein with FMN-binding domain
MLETYHKQAKRKLAATVISLVVIAGVVVYVDHTKALQTTPIASTTQTGQSAATPSSSSSSSGSNSTNSSDSTSTTGSGSSSSSTPASGYKDGSYSVSSDYYVPHGYESITVNLTLQNGKITGASIQNSEGDPESARFQEDFASAYKSYVVGKSISGLQLGVVSGASDTTQGFNDALSQIATKAQS